VPATSNAPATSPVGLPRSFADIAARVNPSVVNVNTKQIVNRPSPQLPPLGLLGVPQEEQVMMGTGSGFIIDSDGYILTNAHVVGEAADLHVQLADDRNLPATVVGLDHDTDVALLRIEAPNLVPVPLGDSDALAVGDWVVAIGNPFGLSHTVTAGIVSARGRTNAEVALDPFGLYDFIQTDAAINQGNSGGPLLDMRGEVVGINTAIHATGQGIGFAIPINMVKVILPHLRTSGRFERAWLGIGVGDVPHELVERLRLDSPHGALVGQVIPGGPAERAGLRTDDVILSFNGRPIGHSSELPWLAATAGAGTRAHLRIWREGAATEVPVVLGRMPHPQ
jgi:serine protease Do